MFFYLKKIDFLNAYQVFSNLYITTSFNQTCIMASIVVHNSFAVLENEKFASQLFKPINSTKPTIKSSFKNMSFEELLNFKGNLVVQRDTDMQFLEALEIVDEQDHAEASILRKSIDELDHVLAVLDESVLVNARRTDEKMKARREIEAIKSRADEKAKVVTAFKQRSTIVCCHSGLALLNALIQLGKVRHSIDSQLFGCNCADFQLHKDPKRKICINHIGHVNGCTRDNCVNDHSNQAYLGIACDRSTLDMLIDEESVKVQKISNGSFNRF
jgi:hypothetical protein